MSSITDGRCAHSAISVNNKIFVFGGMNLWPADAAPGPNTCSAKHYDVGHDYRNTDGQTSAHANTVDDCCQLCANRRTDPPCNYFTFVQADHMCYMKSTNNN